MNKVARISSPFVQRPEDWLPKKTHLCILFSSQMQYINKPFNFIFHVSQKALINSHALLWTDHPLIHNWQIQSSIYMLYLFH